MSNTIFFYLKTFIHIHMYIFDLRYKKNVLLLKYNRVNHFIYVKVQ